MSGSRELTNSGDRGDDFSELELVQDGGLTSGIETHHQNPHLLLGEEPTKELREREPHGPKRSSSTQMRKITSQQKKKPQRLNPESISQTARTDPNSKHSNRNADLDRNKPQRTAIR